MVVASASKDGIPWVSPVFFAYDADYNLYWISYKLADHSELLRANPKASIVIFDSSAQEGDGDGVYFQCDVEELSDEAEISKAMNVLDSRVEKDEFRIKKIQDVTGDGVWRIYKAIPNKVSKLTKGEYINGQLIDKRVEISLNNLKNIDKK